jgi:tRNA(adenine34) deaminase
MNDMDYMRQAYGEALEAYEEGEIPVGAVVVCDGQVIASAHNETERLCDVTAHAEMLALTAAANELGGKYLNECTLYVTLEPCIMCAGATGWAQVKRLVYGTSDEKRGYTLFAPSPLHPKTEVTTGVMKEECEELMKKFFREKR